jgi:hypothetical protein
MLFYNAFTLQRHAAIIKIFQYRNFGIICNYILAIQVIKYPHNKILKNFVANKN